MRVRFTAPRVASGAQGLQWPCGSKSIAGSLRRPDRSAIVWGRRFTNHQDRCWTHSHPIPSHPIPPRSTRNFVYRPCLQHCLERMRILLSSLVVCHILTLQEHIAGQPLLCTGFSWGLHKHSKDVACCVTIWVSPNRPYTSPFKSWTAYYPFLLPTFGETGFLGTLDARTCGLAGEALLFLFPEHMPGCAEGNGAPKGGCRCASKDTKRLWL